MHLRFTSPPNLASHFVRSAQILRATPPKRLIPSSKRCTYLPIWLTTEGKTPRDLPTKDRLTTIELRLFELNERFLDLEARCRELEDYLDLPTND
jgi:hypothetical protein